jgi:hypothetical protein
MGTIMKKLNLKKIIAAKYAKIGGVAALVVAVLVCAFVLAPDAPKDTSANTTTGSITQTEESSVDYSQAESDVPTVKSDSANAGTPALPDKDTDKAQEKTTEKSTEKSAEKEAADKPERKTYEKPSTAKKSTSPTKSSKSTKDKYNTDPTPAGKPTPTEPQDTAIDTSKKLTCVFSIRCDTILNNMGKLDPDKLPVLPEDGTILAQTTVTFSQGESVFDVLKRITRDKEIHMEFSNVPMYNSAYIEGIHNLYEFDCGELSGWMYRVNSWFPNYGCSRYVLKQGDVVEWLYTCDLGYDVGGGYAVGE